MPHHILTVDDRVLVPGRTRGISSTTAMLVLAPSHAQCTAIKRAISGDVITARVRPGCRGRIMNPPRPRLRDSDRRLVRAAPPGRPRSRHARWRARMGHESTECLHLYPRRVRCVSSRISRMQRGDGSQGQSKAMSAPVQDSRHARPQTAHRETRTRSRLSRYRPQGVSTTVISLLHVGNGSIAHGKKQGVSRIVLCLVLRGPCDGAALMLMQGAGARRAIWASLDGSRDRTNSLAASSGCMRT